MNYYFSDFDLSQFFTPLYIFPILYIDVIVVYNFV